MRRFFTKHFLLMLLGFAAIDVMGQINTLKITAPAGIAGEYAVQRFNWGPIISTAVSGAVGYGVDATSPFNDGCSDFTNDLTGKIGFVDREPCAAAAATGVVNKAARIEKIGAIAAIICNTTTGSAANAIGGGGVGVQMKISTYMMSDADCKKIKASILAGGVTAELINKPVTCTTTYGPEVFWGNVAGQGDFSGGLNGWTIENATPDLNTRTTWFWTETGFPRSARGFTDNNIKSTTQCNGAACMDLEALQFEDNPSPAQPYNEYSSSLVSPAIDCRGKSKINLQFRMFHNRLNGSASYQLFDGTSWGDAVLVPTANAVNVSAVGETAVIPVPEFAGKENCRIKFIVEGDFYAFVVDDVILYEKEIVDVVVNKDWVAVAPTLKVPATQVSPMPFMADISNIGNTASQDVVLSVDIKDASGTLLKTVTNNYGTVDGATKVENSPFAEKYTPPAVPGKYTGEYYISGSNEPAENNGNNNYPFQFYVTDKTFGNVESEAEQGSAYLEDVADSWVVSDITNYHSAGNVYYVQNGAKYTVSEVRFGLKNDPSTIDGSGYVFVDLFEVTDVTSLSPTTRTLVATGAVLLDVTAIDDFRNIPVQLFVPNADGGPSEEKLKSLKDNTNYFLTVNTAPLDPSFDRYQFLQYSGNGSDVFDRSVYVAPVNFALDSLKMNRLCGTYWQRVGVDNTYDDIRSRTYQRLGNEGFGTWSMLYLEMDVEKAESTYNVNSTAEVKVFPNPAARELYIDITLENVSNNVKVDLVSMDGKTVLSKSFDGVQDSRLKIDLTNVTTGTYSALIHTNEGVITKKVIVQK